MYNFMVSDSKNRPGLFLCVKNVHIAVGYRYFPFRLDINLKALHYQSKLGLSLLQTTLLL